MTDSKLTLGALDYIEQCLEGRGGMDVFISWPPKANEFSPYVTTVPILKAIIALARQSLSADMECETRAQRKENREVIQGEVGKEFPACETAAADPATITASDALRGVSFVSSAPKRDEIGELCERLTALGNPYGAIANHFYGTDKVLRQAATALQQQSEELERVRKARDIAETHERELREIHKDDRTEIERLREALEAISIEYPHAFHSAGSKARSALTGGKE